MCGAPWGYCKPGLAKEVTPIMRTGRISVPAGRQAHSLESLEKPVFSFASRSRLEYPMTDPSSEPFPSMIVCSCNVLSDHDVRRAVSVAQMPPRTPGQVYGCLGCSAQCGRCARTIKQIMDEALGPCARSCCSGCPHSHAGAEPDVQAEFALAAS